MELWLDAASGGTPPGVHPADRCLFAAGDVVPDWTERALFACEDGRILDADTQPVGAHVDIGDGEGQDAASSLVGLVRWLVVSTSDWQMIPLENLVAAAQGTATAVIARVETRESLRGAAFALETGVDGLLLPADEAEIWAEAQTLAAERLARASDAEEIESDPTLVEVEVTEVTDGGVGDRVCVDLTSLLEVGEGILVGSSASALVLVHGETLESAFVPPRPFRVNAGAVHAYVLMADGTTRYLSEVQAGDEVAVSDASGHLRSAVVGRMKIETRPFILLRFCEPDIEVSGQAFLQQAETVRLVAADGTMPSVTAIRPGQRLLGRIGGSARHIGENVLSGAEER